MAEQTTADLQNGQEPAGALDNETRSELERLRLAESNLRAQLQASEARLDQNQRTIDAFLSSRPSESSRNEDDPPHRFQVPEFSDPSLKPDEFRDQFGRFAQDLENRSTRSLEDLRKQVREDLDQDRNARTLEVLWKDFQDENPRYRGMTTFVASAVRDELQERGLQSPPRDLDTFKQSVKRRCDAMFTRMQENEGQKETNRTGDLGGGSKGGKPKEQTSEPPKTTFADQIYKIQEQMGYL